ncbi:MAG: extracellular solute-binding protein [Lachnospiraceae bacterium]|nr:extracellular solute-binding protein [Lachnospiraceae bacterium]
MKKKTLLWLLTVSMTATLLAGCGGGGSSDETASKAAVSGEDGPAVPYTDTLTLSLLYENDAGIVYPEGDGPSDNVVTRFMKDKLNIAFDMSWTVDKGNYAEQLDLAIASNTRLPDVFKVNKRQMSTLASADLIYDMGELFEKYASDNLKKVLAFNDNEGIKSATIDGKLYGLPLTNDVGDGVSMIFIRKDWLDTLGLQVPSTLHELIDVAKAFVDQNVSGKPNGTMGIGMAKDLGFTWDVIANAYGGYPDLWREGADGRLAYGSTLPEIKDGLACLRELYASGLINSEFAAQETSKLAQYVAQGRLGIFIGPFWYNNNYIINNFNADPDADWIVVNNLPLEQGGSVATRAWNTTYRWWCVSKKCPNPEAAVKLMNLWYEMWQGEYSDWYWDLQMSDEYEDVDMKTYSPVFFDPPLKNCELDRKLLDALESGDTSNLNAEGMNAYSHLTLDDGSPINRSSILTWKGSFRILNDTYDSFVYDAYRGPTDIQFSAIQSVLDELETNTFIDIIMGKKDVSYFDTFVEEWYSQGGTELTERVNEWYENNR